MRNYCLYFTKEIDNFKARYFVLAASASFDSLLVSMALAVCSNTSDFVVDYY